MNVPHSFLVIVVVVGVAALFPLTVDRATADHGALGCE